MNMQRFLIAAGFLLAIANTVPAQTSDPAALPAHDHHEGLLIAADPYADAARAKEKFGKANPVPTGIIPIEIFLKNETDMPLRIDLSTIRLEISSGPSRQRVEPLTAGQTAQIIVHPNGAQTPEARRTPVPKVIPLPSKDKKVKQMTEMLEPFALDADVIPPQATIHGFLFFDFGSNFDELRKASIYVPGISMIPSNKPLTYFEIDLGPAVRD
jgi:hypothetical protein